MFYRVNMADLSVKEEERVLYQGLGGRALSSRIIACEVDARVHPLSAENKLVFVTGMLTGTGAPNTGRMSVGAKSPLTGTIKESNVGGNMGHKLGRLGIRGIIVEGLPVKEGATYVLEVSAKGVSVRDMPALSGLNIYATVDKLRDDFGPDAAIGCIGTAGEHRMTSACIGFTDMEGAPSRQAGRGGLGAVMGSKGLKAIVCNDTGAAQMNCVDEAAFRAGAQKLSEALLAHAVANQPREAEDLAYIVNEAGGLPVRNFDHLHAGADHADNATLSMARGGGRGRSCSPGCVIHCAQIRNDKKRNSLTGGFAYDTFWGFGPNLGIDNLDDIAVMNHLCDDYGVDAIEMAVALGVAMEAGVAQFGDSKAAIALIHEMGKATSLGRILGAGAEVTGKVFGVRRVPVVKSQGIPAYDPRAVKGVGVTYATSTMGADHTAGYSAAANMPDVGVKVDPHRKEGQVDLSRTMQIATAFLDSAGICLFIAFAVLDIPTAMQSIVEMCNARYGWHKTLEDYLETGKQVLRDERAFNLAAGIGEGADDLPDFFRTEPLSPGDAVYDITRDELHKVFDF